MKRFATLLFAALAALTASAQKPSEYNYQKRSLFELLPISGRDIVFLGNSITDGCEWAELFDNPRIKNRGISADRTYFMLERLDPIVEGRPKKLFLLIGINDLGANESPESVVENIGRIVERFQRESPRTRIYVQSVFPVNDSFAKYAKRQGSKDAEILRVNAALEKLCVERGITYIDVYSALADGNGKLRSELTNDGLHLLGEGYMVWKGVIEKYVR